MVDSTTIYTGCVPIKGKNDFAVMVREILQFTQVVGHAECNYLCDNEPSIRQVQERAVRARQSMGLATHTHTARPLQSTHMETAFVRTQLEECVTWQVR